MKPNLKRHVLEHLESHQLDEQQLRRLERLQRRGGRTWLSRRRVPVSALGSVLLLAAVVLLWPAEPGVALKIADEVAVNHLKQRPLEVRGANVAALQSYFDELDFRLVQTSLGNVGRDRMLGGRYCSIQGVTAAQLRLRDAAGRTETLYQVRYDASRFGALPDVGGGQAPWSAQVRGLTVDLWVEKGLLFARTRE